MGKDTIAKKILELQQDNENMLDDLSMPELHISDEMRACYEELIFDNETVIIALKKEWDERTGGEWIDLSDYQ